MSDLVKQLKSVAEGKIVRRAGRSPSSSSCSARPVTQDFAGQARAERTNQQILIFSGVRNVSFGTKTPSQARGQVLAFVAGFSLQSLRLCMAIYVLGCLACAVVRLADWSALRIDIDDAHRPSVRNGHISAANR
jgi:hypothetical protein